MADIDLRPMTLGEVLDRTFSLYKRNFWLFAGIVGLPYLVVVILSMFYTTSLLSGLPAAGTTVTPADALRELATMLGGMVLFMLVYLIVYAAAQAATVMAVSDLYLGRPASVHSSYARVGGRILPVLLVMILVFLMAGAGMLIFIVPGIVLLCRTALAVPAVALEDIGVGDAIARSFRLTKGTAWGIFAVYALVFFLTYLAMFVFQVPFLVAAGSPLKPHILSLGLRVLQGVASWVSGVIVAPIATIAFSLIYYNQRVRKEAFDLEKLMAALEPGQTPPSPSAA